MTRSIDNVFVRALSKNRPVQLGNVVPVNDAVDVAVGRGESGPDGNAPTQQGSTQNSARIEFPHGETFLRVEQPSPGDSPISAPHLTFQAQAAPADVGQIAIDDLAAFLSFSADTQSFAADSIPFPASPISPSSPPHPHIAPSGAPAKPSQKSDAPEQREIQTPDSQTSDSQTSESLNQAAVERILEQRENELNAVFERRLILGTAEQAPEKTQAPETQASETQASETQTQETQTQETQTQETHSVEASVELATPKSELAEQSPSVFQPAWEVDVFQWPEIVEDLLRDQGAQLAQAGEQLRQAAADGLQVLGVTSTFRGEGRTSLAMCIARCVANAGANVVLVDMDADHPDLASALRVRPSVGWREVINEQLPLEEAVIHFVDDGVSLVAIDSGTESQINLRDPQVGDFIEKLRREYDLVLLDCGPLVDESKFLDEGANCPLNAAIVVRDLRTTSAEDCQRTVARLLMHGVEAVGIAENFNRATS